MFSLTFEFQEGFHEVEYDIDDMIAKLLGRSLENVKDIEVMFRQNLLSYDILLHFFFFSHKKNQSNKLSACLKLLIFNWVKFCCRCMPSTLEWGAQFCGGWKHQHVQWNRSSYQSICWRWDFILSVDIRALVWIHIYVCQSAHLCCNCRF